jgi:DNA recombination protein RmuC
MEILIAAVIGLLVILIILVFNLMNKSKSSGASTDSMQLLQNQMASLAQMQVDKLDRITREMNDRLKEQNLTLNDQMSRSQSNLMQQFQVTQRNSKEASDTASKVIQEVTQKLTRLEETNTRIVEYSQQLKSLEDILKNPKQRGVLGEFFLEAVLKNVLPPQSYQMQYKFLDGEIVDSVVFVKDKIIPIDSKFSLENYNRMALAADGIERDALEKIFKEDLKKRIDETSKYVRQSEGTMDFAFMFIPSEGVYYDLLTNKIANSQDLISYAFGQKKVIIVSPTSFLAYLQTVLQGLRALQIEESAKQILTQVTNLKKHIDKFEVAFARIGKNLGQTVSAFNETKHEIKMMDKDFFKLTGEKIEIIAEELDKPSADE